MIGIFVKRGYGGSHFSIRGEKSVCSVSEFEIRGFDLSTSVRLMFKV